MSLLKAGVRFRALGRYLSLQKPNGILIVNQCMAELEFPLTKSANEKREARKG